MKQYNIHGIFVSCQFSVVAEYVQVNKRDVCFVPCCHSTTQHSVKADL